jgi:hypothetical protein
MRAPTETKYSIVHSLIDLSRKRTVCLYVIQLSGHLSFLYCSLFLYKSHYIFSLVPGKACGRVIVIDFLFDV